MDAVASDHDWLLTTLERTGDADPFTGRLVRMLRIVLNEGVRQPLALGIFRSDYMVDAPPGEEPRIRQIELNTISSAFAGLSSVVADVHAYLLSRHAVLCAAVATAHGLPQPSTASLPPNACMASVVDALAAAVAAYTSARSPAAPPVVAFVVQPRERNVMDQRLLEHELWRRHGVRVRRTTLADVAAAGPLRPHDGALLLPAEALGEADEVAVVYYRCGYTPDDYPTDAEWDGRLLAERSAAIKCPDLRYHLCGTKKVQQALAAPGVLERFVPAETSATLRACFAGLWSLDPDEATPEAAAAVADAAAHPDRYVIKPQREGGGNNLFGAAVAAALRADGEGMPPAQLRGHILMERVFPAVTPALMTRGGGAAPAPAVCELGVYSVLLAGGAARRVLLSAAAGHLVRTKTEGTDEGGVAAGYAVLDSPRAGGVIIEAQILEARDDRRGAIAIDVDRSRQCICRNNIESTHTLYWA